MSTKVSSKHHYVPKFYLSGFTNENNEFLIYLVESGRFKKNGKFFSPESHFFEVDANTLTNANNEKSDFIEKYYSDTDNKVAKVFEKIKSSSEKDYGVTNEEIPLLQLFVSKLFWRLPSNRQLVEELVRTKAFKQLGMVVKDRSTGEPINDTNFEEMIKGHPDFYKFVRSWLPLATYSTIFNCTSPLTIIPFPPQLPAICSDNPLILRHPDKLDIYNDDFILPLTKDKILIRTQKLKKMIVSNVKIEIDMLLVAQAKEYICCTDKRYISMLKSVFLNEYKTTDYLREAIFDKMIEE